MSRSLLTAFVWIAVGMGVAFTFHTLEKGRKRTAFQARGGVVEIQRGDDGHYHWPGTINGHAVVFLIDTGATGTAVSSKLARRLKLEAQGEVRSSTANGVVTGQRVRADIVLQGGVTVTSLRMVAMPALGDHPLLGMDVLGRLRWQQRDGVLSFDLRDSGAPPSSSSFRPDTP